MSIATDDTALAARLFLKTPEGQQALAKEKAKELQRRRELVVERAAIVKKAPAERARFQREAERTRLAWRESVERTNHLEGEHRLAQAADWGYGHQVSTQLARIDTELREGAPAIIDRCKERLLADWASLRRAGVESVESRSTNARGLEERTTRTNQSKVLARIKAIQAGLAACEELKLTAIEDDQLEKKLASIEANLPSIRIDD
jgi:hypothetical protein